MQTALFPMELMTTEIEPEGAAARKAFATC